MAKETGKMEGLVTLSELQRHYGGKKVFLTGHTGFKGAWMMACLHLAGATVSGYALAPEYEQGLFNVLGSMEGVSSCLADIRDRERLRHTIRTFQPDYIFHLAAQPLVRRSYEIPAETFEINVTGTANLLEAAGLVEKPCAVVVITTDKVYENKETGVLYKESDPLGGHDPYSTSKACAELVTDSFRRSFFNKGPAVGNDLPRGLASARAGNVIGGGDWSRDRIVPDIVRALSSGRVVEVRNPSSVRPWQHVLEPVCGYLQLGCRLYEDTTGFGKAYNFGPLPADHLEVRELVELAIQAWGSGAWSDVSTPNAPHESGVLRLDIGLAGRDLGWFPRLTAKEAIQWSMDWYCEAPDGRANLTFQQIKSYLAR